MHPLIQRHTADTGAIQIEVIDTLAAQREMFAAPVGQRREVGNASVGEALRGWWEPMRDAPWMPHRPDPDDPLGYALMLNIAPPSMDAAEAIGYLDRFDAAGSLDACADALVRAFDALKPSAHGIALPTIYYTLALANPSIINDRDNRAGYTGFGGNPGRIMMIALPSAFNLPRLPGMAAHEAHHNVRLSFEPWNPATITVGQYMVIEGLAEAFAVELYGEDALGPWTTMHDAPTLEAHRARYREVMHEVGDPRAWLFGDWAAAEFHYEPQGLPDYLGYGMGYRIVRSYLEATGTPATAATYTPWAEIIAGSAWLHEG